MNDAKIAKLSYFIGEGAETKIAIDIDGEPFTGLVGSRPSPNLMTKWCEQVRAEIDARREAAKPPPRDKTPAPTQEIPDETGDPADYVKHNLEAAEMRYATAKKEYEAAESTLKIWERLAAALEGE